MVFIYPALVSGNIEQRYFPGMIKTLELYFLHHIAEAATSGVLKFYVVQDRITGKFSSIKMESTDVDNLKGEYKPIYVLENEVFDTETRIDFMQKDLNERQKDLSLVQKMKKDILVKTKSAKINPSQPEYEEYIDLVNQEEKLKNEIEYLRRSLDNAYRDLNQARITQKKLDQDEANKAQDKLSKEVHTGAATIKVDTQTIMDLRPTSITLDATVDVRKRDSRLSVTTKSAYPERRSIPVSVKVIPIVINDFSNIYNVLVDDFYSNKFSSVYRSTVRSFGSKVMSWAKPIINAYSKVTMGNPDEVNFWKDIIFRQKGFVDSSTFKNSARGPKYQKYSSAIVLMSADDIRGQEKNLFDNPRAVYKLFKMGWNSFGIMDDTEQKLTFCSYYESGMCTKIPYSYLFHSLKASDLFKEMEQLSSFTKRVIGSFKRVNYKSLSEKINMNQEVADKINYQLNEYLKDIS